MSLVRIIKPKTSHIGKIQHFNIDKNVDQMTRRL